jgi:hypothetical protein
MTGPITSPEEWEIELAVWRLRCRQSEARGEPKPVKPVRVWGARTAAERAAVDAWLNAHPDACLGGGTIGVRHTPSRTMQHDHENEDAMTRNDTNG